jgi:hypothetical protein
MGHGWYRVERHPRDLRDEPSLSYMGGFGVLPAMPVPHGARADAMPELEAVDGLAEVLADPDGAPDKALLWAMVSELDRTLRAEGFVLIGFGTWSWSNPTPVVVYASPAVVCFGKAR